MNPNLLTTAVWNITPASFLEVALSVFRWQVQHVPVYGSWVKTLGISIEEVSSLQQIPFLPISFFKSHSVIADNTNPVLSFKSSGTTGTTTSLHHLANVEMYQKSCLLGFQNVFGSPQDWCFVSLLPSYLENTNSSLIYMMNYLHQLSNYPQTGFFKEVDAQVAELLKHLNQLKVPTLVTGVSYALLDLAEQFPNDYSNILFMETGGMKGRRKELIRAELHQILQNAFRVDAIYSEYGMTELLSQAYAKSNGMFVTPPWMKVLIRETTDPFTYVAEGATGGINVIDLANLYSCAFIETQDLGRMHLNKVFEVLGRFDYSDVRGCNLLAQ